MPMWWRESRPALKRLMGKGAYVLEMLRQLARFPFPVYRVSIDGAAHEAASVVVARGRYYGGRFVVAPEARLDRAELHVCLFRRGGIFRTLRYAIALGMGSWPSFPISRSSSASAWSSTARPAIPCKATATSSPACR